MPPLAKQPATQKLILYTLVGLGLYTLLPFLLLTIYTHPAADDFSFAVRDRSSDYITVFREFYTSWTGRYFSTITMFQLNPIIYGSLFAYKLYAAVLISVFAGVLYFFVRRFTERVFNKGWSVALAAVLLTLYFLQAPSISEAFYFFSTYATYQVPHILFMLMLVLVYKLFQADTKLQKQLYIGLAAILCVAIVGSNEMILIVAFTTTLLLTIVNYKNPEARRYLLFLFIICLAACAVAILAPGNYNRMSDQPNAGKFVWSVAYAGFMTALSFYRWLIPVLAASMVYVVYFGLPLATKPNRTFNINPWLAVLYFLGTIFLMNFLFAWSTGERPTPRLENVIYFFFILGWFYLMQVFICKYKHKLSAFSQTPAILPLMALLIFILSVLHIDSNISTAYIDLASGKATAYNKALNERYRTLQTTDCDTCLLPPLPTIPKTIYFADVISGQETDRLTLSRHWINKGVANYFSKDSVRLTERNPPVISNLHTLRSAGKAELQ